MAALIQAGVSRVVLGIRHPLAHLRGKAVRALRSSGVTVDILEDAGSSVDPQRFEECLHACLQVNEVRRDSLLRAPCLTLVLRHHCVGRHDCMEVKRKQCCPVCLSFVFEKAFLTEKGSAERERKEECCGVQALLHRAVTGRPFSILKYAMTADGKIATSTGHSAWVSSPASRQLVFDARARSDAVIVGGNTVRHTFV